jgi:hypothetical protein
MWTVYGNSEDALAWAFIQISAFATAANQKVNEAKFKTFSGHLLGASLHRNSSRDEVYPQLSRTLVQVNSAFRITWIFVQLQKVDQANFKKASRLSQKY